MIKKIVVTGDEARGRIFRGVELIGKIVGATLGPAGRNAIIYRKYKPPLITNDGVSIARHTYMEDEIEDLGAQTIVEAAMKTNEQAGDGTTTSVVLAVALVKECFERINGDEVLGPKTNSMALKRDIENAKNKAVQSLISMSRPLEPGDLKSIISTSLENLEYGEKIAEMIEAVGKDGYISVEDNWATQYGVETEVILGMKFLGKYASPYMMTNARKEAVWEDAPILVTNHRIESVEQLKPLFEELNKQQVRKLVVIGGYSEGVDAFSKPFITILANSIIAAQSGKPGILSILAIKAPSLTSPELEDVAAYVNAKFVDKSTGWKLKDVMVSHLGGAKKIVVNESDTIITGGNGIADQRIAILQEQLDTEKDQMFKEKLKRRIASLSSGIGVIRVGAMTESESGYLKLKIEDAVAAAKAAIEEGVVPGGGLALKEVAEQLGEDNILYKVLQEPYNKIQENAGQPFEISPEVLDPVKVTRLALLNAVSAAGILITTETGISERRKSLWDELEKKIYPADERNSFRDSENMDLGAGRLIED